VTLVDTRSFDAGKVTSELHRVRAEDIQKIDEALGTPPDPEAKEYDKARKGFLRKLASALRATTKVVVEETLKVKLTATAADLTSAHYYPQEELRQWGIGPALSQSAFGSIDMDLESTLQLSYELAGVMGTTTAMSATPPVPNLSYHTVVDSTSYRPNLVLAASFHRELTSRPAPVPYLLSALVAIGLGRAIDVTWAEAGLLTVIGLEALKGQRATTTQALALVVTPRPRTALPSTEMLDVALRFLTKVAEKQREKKNTIASAVEKYKEKYDRFPCRLKDLVETELLGVIPRDPFTGQADWIYDPDEGSVTSRAPYAQDNVEDDRPVLKQEQQHKKQRQQEQQENQQMEQQKKK
jgi:hypothetical protein